MVLQTVHPCLALVDVALQRLGFGEFDLLILNHRVVAPVGFSELGLQRGPLGRVHLGGDGILKLDNFGIHIGDIRAQTFQLRHRHLAIVQRFDKVDLDLGLLLFKHSQLPFEQLHNRIRLGDQIL